MNKQEALQHYIGTYFGIEKKEIEVVAGMFKEEQLNKGDHFLKAEQYCEKMSFVQSGLLRVYATSGHKDVTQWISTKDYFITELNSYLFGQRSRWNIQALSDCRLFTLHKDDYRKLHEAVPSWPILEKNFIAGCFVTLENRVFDFLSMSAEERYRKLFDQNKELFQQVPQQYLASMLGMSPETLSRIRAKHIS